MKKNKKAGIEISLTQIASLAIFLTMTIAILLWARGCSGRIADSSLDELKSAIDRVKSVDGSVEIIEVFIGPESAIIGYAPNHPNLITRYVANEVSMSAADALMTNFPQIGQEYVFPKNEKDLSGTMQDSENGGVSNFLGYVKRRALSCPTNEFCVCECINFRLQTEKESLYGSEQAFLECSQEKCQIISGTFLDENLNVYDFLKRESYKQKEDKDYKIQYPPPHTFYWEGGFIFLRTAKSRFYLGENMQTLCGTYSSTTGLINSINFKSCPDSDVLLTKKRIIAGHLDNYMADFFNLKIENKGMGKITIEVT